MTSCWRAGSLAIAARTAAASRRRAAPPPAAAPSCAAGSPSRPGSAGGRAPRKRSGSTAGSSSPAPAERGERHAARLALAAGARAVGDDPQDPGLQRRAALEAVEALQDAEPGLLHDLLGDGAAAHVAERDPQHQRAVAVDERHERVLVAGAQAREEVAIGVDDDVAHGRDLFAVPEGHGRGGHYS